MCWESLISLGNLCIIIRCSTLGSNTVIILVCLWPKEDGVLSVSFFPRRYLALWKDLVIFWSTAVSRTLSPSLTWKQKVLSRWGLEIVPGWQSWVKVHLYKNDWKNSTVCLRLVTKVTFASFFNLSRFSNPKQGFFFFLQLAGQFLFLIEPTV